MEKSDLRRRDRELLELIARAYNTLHISRELDISASVLSTFIAEGSESFHAGRLLISEPAQRLRPRRSSPICEARLFWNGWLGKSIRLVEYRAHCDLRRLSGGMFGRLGCVQQGA
jgi:hypothetical protein